jgi:protein-S-isoprenylcysteine O-methyltransferase Ste14
VEQDEVFRVVLIVGALLVLPPGVYFRIKSQMTGEPLDRWQEGRFILFTLRPVAFVALAGLLAFMIDPSTMAWSSVPLPVWLRWAGVVLAALGGILLLWTFRTLGPNLTDTVVTRRKHTLVTSGPYRWVRHPFYVAGATMMFANALATANWFIMLAFVMTFLLIGMRTRIEEEKLIARFGGSYCTYMNETGRFFPKSVRPRIERV